MKFIFILFAFFTMSIEADTKLSTGLINNPTENWVFLDSFCFTDNATINYTFEYPTKYTNQSLLMYFDGNTNSQWLNATIGNKSCKEKVDILPPKNHQVIQLDSNNLIKCLIFKKNGEDWFQCNDTITMDTRPRYWHFVLSNCDSKIGVYTNYTLSMANLPGSDCSGSKITVFDPNTNEIFKF